MKTFQTYFVTIHNLAPLPHSAQELLYYKYLAAS